MDPHQSQHRDLDLDQSQNSATVEAQNEPERYPYQEPHQSVKSDPGLHLSERGIRIRIRLSDADPQHWFQQTGPWI